MPKTYICKIAVFITLVTMLMAVGTEITTVLAELDEEEIMSLINESLEERNKQYIVWLGTRILKYCCTCREFAGTILDINFKQHLDLTKEHRRVRKNIADISQIYQGGSNNQEITGTAR